MKENKHTDHLDMQSPNIVSQNIEKIAELFPNCVTEGEQGKVIDFDLLKQELSEDIVSGTKERYRLEWPGKKEAIVIANLPTTKTLRPVREDSVDFDNTENIYIEGDNLEVLKILQESYLGKIKMIYIDPPYNTGSDLIYNDNFKKEIQKELEDSAQKNEYQQRLVVNQDASGRYHSDWLSMMYPRLKLSRNLLKTDGVIFASIDDHESHNLKKLMDEVFGELNFIADITVVSNLKGRNDKKYIATANERLLMYVKTDEFQEYGLSLPEEKIKDYKEEDNEGKYRLIELRKRGGPDTRIERPNMFYPFFVNPMNGKVSLNPSDEYSVKTIPVKSNGVEGRWRWGKDTAKLRIKSIFGRAVRNSAKFNIYEKDYLEQKGALKRIKPKSIMSGASYSTDGATKNYRQIMGNIDFTNPKSVEFLSDLIEYTCSPNSNDIILDFFSGSAATAHAALELNTKENGNRKFILVQLPEATDEKSEAYKAGYKNITEIGKERIRRAAKKIKEEKAEKAKKDGLFADYKDDQDYGFRVYRLDESNMQDVYYTPQEYKQQDLELFKDNVKPDRTPEDLLTQVILDWGLPLSLKIEKVDIEGKEVFKVAGNSLYACFDTGVDEAFAKAIAKDQPLRIVFKDGSFKDDTAKENVKQLLKQLSPDTEMRVV